MLGATSGPEFCRVARFFAPVLAVDQVFRVRVVGHYLFHAPFG